MQNEALDMEHLTPYIKKKYIYLCYYPHTTTGSRFPVCGIFCSCKTVTSWHHFDILLHQVEGRKDGEIGGIPQGTTGHGLDLGDIL